MTLTHLVYREHRGDPTAIESDGAMWCVHGDAWAWAWADSGLWYDADGDEAGACEGEGE